MAQILEYKGSIQLVSMRAVIAKAVLKKLQAATGVACMSTKSSG